MKNNKAIRYLTNAAAIAALYVVLTLLAAALHLSSGTIQCRLSEALCVLPMFTKSAIPGLYVGCLLANLVTGCAPWDVVFGSLATLIGAVGTYFLRKNKYAAAFCPVISNVLIVPFVLQNVYGVEDSLPFLMLTVGIGEVISCVILGLLLHKMIEKHANKLFDGR